MAGFRLGKRRVSVSQPSPEHPTDEDLSLHLRELRSLPSPQRAKITHYHPKKQVTLLGGPGRWNPEPSPQRAKIARWGPRALTPTSKNRSLGTPSPCGPRQSERWGAQLYWPDLGHPPAHRDRAAMNGAQLSMAHVDSSRLMSGPPRDSQVPKCEGPGALA